MFNHETRSPDDMMATHGYMRFYPDLSVAGLIGEGVGQYTTAEKDGSSGSKTETYVYADLKGRKLCEIDEYGVVVSYAYDAFGMLSKKNNQPPRHKRNDRILGSARRSFFRRNDRYV